MARNLQSVKQLLWKCLYSSNPSGAVVLTKGLNLSPFAMYFIRTKQIYELFGIIGGLMYAKVGVL